MVRPASFDESKPVGFHRTPTSIRQRALFTILALSLAALVLGVYWPRVSLLSDFDLQIQAARALAAGENPYLTVGPQSQHFFPFGYYYPLPAAFFGAPLAWLPPLPSRLIFVLVSTGILAWIASRDGWIRFPMFVSGAFASAVSLGQWSMLLTASLMAPALAWISAVKPNMALPFTIARLSRDYLLRLVVPGAGLGLLAFVLVPTWPRDWLTILDESPPGSHEAPLLMSGGFVLLLALLRCRTFEGRLLIGMASVPQTGIMYDTLPLFLVCRTHVQSWVMAFCSAAGFMAMLGVGARYLADTNVMMPGYREQFISFRQAFGPYLLATGYLPALGIVLWNGLVDRARRKGRSKAELRQASRPADLKAVSRLAGPPGTVT